MCVVRSKRSTKTWSSKMLSTLEWKIETGRDSVKGEDRISATVRMYASRSLHRDTISSAAWGSSNTPETESGGTADGSIRSSRCFALGTFSFTQTVAMAFVQLLIEGIYKYWCPLWPFSRRLRYIMNDLSLQGSFWRAVSLQRCNIKRWQTCALGLRIVIAVVCLDSRLRCLLSNKLCLACTLIIYFSTRRLTIPNPALT